ncbi:MAG: hypothetical protein ACRD45_14305 [Bryobacteraceae bacterium]
MPLLERERELSKLMQSARYGKPALVCGPPGIGKTQLLLELRRSLIAEGMPVIYVPFVQPLHAFLASVAARLSLRGRSDSSVALRGMLWTSLEANPKMILLDGIAEPSLPFYRFFERLLYVPGMALIGSAAQPYATGALHRIFWNQQTILSLRPLSREASAALAGKAIGTFAPDLADSAFQEQVIQVARGNPGRIVEMCRRAADPAYRDGDRIRFAALSIDSFTRLVS